jgi:hypothetical protein
MKIKKIEQICKEAGQFHLWDELPEMEDDGAVAPVQRQWLGDGTGIYPLDGMPYLDEGGLCTIFDIDEKKRDKLHVFQYEHLPTGVSLADRMSTDEPLEEIRFKMSLGGDELALFRGEDGGLVVIRADYKKPIDNWKDCEFFRRKGESGVWVAVMSGLILRGLIGTYRIREDLVETLGAVYNAAGVALEGDADNEGV